MTAECNIPVEFSWSWLKYIYILSFSFISKLESVCIELFTVTIGSTLPLGLWFSYSLYLFQKKNRFNYKSAPIPTILISWCSQRKRLFIKSEHRCVFSFLLFLRNSNYVSTFLKFSMVIVKTDWITIKGLMENT